MWAFLLIYGFCSCFSYWDVAVGDSSHDLTLYAFVMNTTDKLLAGSDRLIFNSPFLLISIRWMSDKEKPPNSNPFLRTFQLLLRRCQDTRNSDFKCSWSIRATQIVSLSLSQNHFLEWVEVGLEVFGGVSRLDDLHAGLNRFYFSDLRDRETQSLGGEFSVIWPVFFCLLSYHSGVFLYSRETSRPDLWYVVFSDMFRHVGCVSALHWVLHNIYSLWCTFMLQVCLNKIQRLWPFVKPSWLLIQCFTIQTNHNVAPWNLAKHFWLCFMLHF